MVNNQYELLTLEDYIDYFEKLAEKATFLDHFYYGYNEFADNLKKDKVENFIMVIEPYENPMSENQNDNILANRRGFFIILKPYSSKMGRDLVNVQSQCEKICYKVMGQIKRDSRDWKLKSHVSNWRGQVIDPVASNMAGYMMEFTFEAPINRFLTFDQADWKEDEEETPEI